MGVNLRQKYSKNAILYILKKLDSNKDNGRKKIMKLMFLVDYFDVAKERITLRKAIGNTFFIYNYGVFSTEVMRDLSDLIKSGELIETEHDLKVRKGTEPSLNEEIKEKVEQVIKKYGKLKPRELEVFTLNLLNLDRESKYNYMGVNIEALTVG
ncbi:MAG: hypothetical protein CSMARM4_0051 [Candidatus Parvarchaeum acidiphilum ARMAN-4_'5-way FS']|jgi:uncharacterized phage-associated protein|uniref:Antitoxin SocA-like Panacea domain-containing protein n=1 Tax=Candidatus Parvarchaeum acidiphilum ARMAN-4_'5-way FS' TaxID=994837 RepID=F2UTX1_PARA4|nr:MAG: hypothetical protein CSMARM4_0051 [Candidatus Parvarchaeum acidiphilum ARMAN-4_'5-way FS']